MSKSGERLIRSALSLKDTGDLQRRIQAANARLATMSPEQRAALDAAQRESWVRGMMPTGDPRFD